MATHLGPGSHKGKGHMHHNPSNEKLSIMFTSQQQRPHLAKAKVFSRVPQTISLQSNSGATIWTVIVFDGEAHASCTGCAALMASALIKWTRTI